MKHILNAPLTNRHVILAVLGCLLSLGIFFFLLKGCNSIGDTSLRNHPYISAKELKSTEPIAVEPFIEPSLERLVAQFKSELGLTEAEIAETAEMLAQDRFMDNLNFMDSRRDANRRQAEWDRRKRMVVAKPELLWTPGFILPPTLDTSELKDNALYDYDLKHDLKPTKSEEKRVNKLHRQWQNGKITELEYERGRAAIITERFPPIIVARLNYDSGSGSVESKVGMEYAELAIAENPDSFEAHHVWALCYHAYYRGRDYEKYEKSLSGFRQLVERFPNSSIAHYELAEYVAPPSHSPHKIALSEEALFHVKRAMQLDDRIEPNHVLAICYSNLGEYEKALAVFQGMSEVTYSYGIQLMDIYEVQRAVYELRQQQSE